MIACTRCGKENQNHYKFCLGCGAELTSAPPAAPAGDASVGMMKTMMADPSASPPARASGPAASLAGPAGYAPPRPAGPPPGVAAPPPLGGAGLGGRSAAGGWAAPTAAPGTAPPMGPPPVEVAVPHPIGHAPSQGQLSGPTAGLRACPSCGSEVPANFKFCGACGSAIAAAPVPAPAQTHTPQPVAPPAPRAHMTLIRPDGSEGGTYPLRQGENVIGRSHGEIFEQDGYLSPTHAALIVEGTAATVRDLGSLNGVFVRMSGEEEIAPRQIVRIGQELLRFDLIEAPAPLDDGTEVMGSPNPGFWGKITVVIGNGVDGSAYPLLGDAVTLGRERGDINFPDDGYVSGLHARLALRGGKCYLSDLGSSNGTFVKIQGERALGHESFVLLGQQLFRLALK